MRSPDGMSFPRTSCLMTVLDIVDQLLKSDFGRDSTGETYSGKLHRRKSAQRAHVPIQVKRRLQDSMRGEGAGDCVI